jgi:hypothetical protein
VEPNLVTGQTNSLSFLQKHLLVGKKAIIEILTIKGIINHPIICGGKSYYGQKSFSSHLLHLLQYYLNEVHLLVGRTKSGRKKPEGGNFTAKTQKIINPTEKSLRCESLKVESNL